MYLNLHRLSFMNMLSFTDKFIMLDSEAFFISQSISISLFVKGYIEFSKKSVETSDCDLVFVDR